MSSKHLFSCLVAAMLATTVVANETIDSLLNVYTFEIGRAQVYTSRRQARIDSLRAITPMTPANELALAREYQHFQSDSARSWYLRLRYTDEPIRTEAFIGLIQLLSSSGHYTNAFDLINLPESPSLTSVEGYKTLWLLYNEAITSGLLPTYGNEELAAKAQQYYDSLLVALERDTVNPVESSLWLSLYHAYDRGEWDQALSASRQLLSRYRPDQHRYAILAYGHADIYEHAGNLDKRREWLIRSAITDVLCGITDNGSSWMVAEDCYKEGDLNHAYIISNYTLTNASFFNAPTRYVQTYALGHTIGNEYDRLLQNKNIALVIALSAFAIVLFVLVLSIIYAYWQNRKLSTINHQLSVINSQLQAANHVKEQYICRYLEVYNDYIRRLTTMARRAGEKDPSAFMDREMENFYRSFDDTFLSLYGTFVEDFNALLKPEARLTPKPGERMTVEMRIFALILLGIDSSAKIAELLCYSPNTISNYRVKIKNNALGNRDTFESRIRSLSARY